MLYYNITSVHRGRSQGLVGGLVKKREIIRAETAYARVIR